MNGIQQELNAEIKRLKAELKSEREMKKQLLEELQKRITSELELRDYITSEYSREFAELKQRLADKLGLECGLDIIETAHRKGWEQCKIEAEAVVQAADYDADSWSRCNPEYVASRAIAIMEYKGANND